MSKDRHDDLLEQDWSAIWESLPEAPELVGRPKVAQITLRVPAGLIPRIKKVAAIRTLPYHSLARSWILAGLRESTPPESALDEPQEEQLNIKLDQNTLDKIKARASELRRPYHRLARDWIESSLAAEETSLGLDPSATGQPPIKDLIVLLLHAKNKSGHSSVRGITQLQKLLFVVEQKLASESSYYAFNYGPFNEQVNDAAHALRIAGFLKDSKAVSSAPPSYEVMLATIRERSGPQGIPSTEIFALNEDGHAAAERLRKSSNAYDKLFDYIATIRTEWDTPKLLERVYETWPKYAEKSHIRDEVAQRRRERR